MTTKYILFDFDGVIANSYKPAFEVQKMIHPQITDEEYKKRFEGNINDWEEPINAHTKACRHDIDFFTEYLPKMQHEVALVVGMREVLEELQKHYALIVVSSTITSPIEEFFERHQLTDYFTKVMGNDVHKSKVEKIKMVFLAYATSPQQCVFVTDTLGDMREASRCQIGSIGVLWGFHAQATLLQGNPFRLVTVPHQLPLAVADYFQQQVSTK